MRVRMRVNMSGTRNGERWPARGDVVNLPEREAGRMVAMGLASAVGAVDDRETAVQPAPETRKPATRTRTSGMTKAVLDGDTQSD